MDNDRYADLRGRLDAAQVVLQTLLEYASFKEGDEARLKAEILRYADGMRECAGEGARENPISIAQADAMAGYATHLRST